MKSPISLAAKKNLEQYITLIDPRLDEYWHTELERKFGFNEKQKKLVEEILAHSQEHNLRPAKRLRASFVHYAYLLNHAEIDERIWKVAMSVELVHTALLMHDDFMDQDMVRRGKPTTHEYFNSGDTHYGHSMAVNVGDAVLCAGFQLLHESGFSGKSLNDAMSKMLRGITNTAFGQAYDVTLEKLKNEWTEDDVTAVHKAKTSVYTYENPLFIGAYLAGLPPEAFGILHDYAMDGGVAFQMQDDILGVFGDTENTGKSANSDLLQGKATLLVMKVFHEGSPSQIQALEKVWGKREAELADIQNAKQAIIDSGSLEYSNKVSRGFAQRAAQYAEKLHGLRLNPDSIEYIQGIAQYMVEREL
jgi:geranylgeranyl diphosphate synthase type I